MIKDGAPRIVIDAKDLSALRLEVNTVTRWPELVPYENWRPSECRALGPEASSWFKYIQIVGGRLCDGFVDVSRNYIGDGVSGNAYGVWSGSCIQQSR